jgi:TonB family protein
MLKYFLIISLIVFPILIFPQQGLIKSYYDNGKLKSEINYANNIREGDAKFYYDNGVIEEERNYVNGKVDGLVKRYNKDGKLKEVFNIEDGKRDGPTSLYDSAGVYLSDLNFKNGIKVIEAPEEETAEVTQTKENKIENKIASNTKKIKRESPLPLPPSAEMNRLENDPAYFLTAEVMPEPVGGLNELQKRVFYPALAKNKKIEGTVKILAFIDHLGKVTRADVVEGIGYGCDEAARNAVLYSSFNPGLIRGKPVNVQMIIPIKFKLINQQ